MGECMTKMDASARCGTIHADVLIDLSYLYLSLTTGVTLPPSYDRILPYMAVF